MTWSHHLEICCINTAASSPFGGNKDGEHFTPSPGGRQRFELLLSEPVVRSVLTYMPFLSHCAPPCHNWLSFSTDDRFHWNPFWLPASRRTSLRQLVILSPHGVHHGQININGTDSNLEDISEGVLGRCYDTTWWGICLSSNKDSKYVSYCHNMYRVIQEIIQWPKRITTGFSTCLERDV